MKLIDKSNGYIFAGIEPSAVEFSKIAVQPVDWDYYRYPFNFRVFNYVLFTNALQEDVFVIVFPVRKCMQNSKFEHSELC